MFEAVLVSLADHGFTPTAIAARLTYTSAPESVAGRPGCRAPRRRLAVPRCDRGLRPGSCPRRWPSCTTRPDRRRGMGRGRRRAASSGPRRRGGSCPASATRSTSVEDPRTPVLFDLAREQGTFGTHLQLFAAIGRVHPRILGRTLPLNGAGTCGAVLADLDLPRRRHARLRPPGSLRRPPRAPGRGGSRPDRDGDLPGRRPQHRLPAARSPRSPVGCPHGGTVTAGRTLRPTTGGKGGTYGCHYQPDDDGRARDHRGRRSPQGRRRHRAVVVQLGRPAPRRRHPSRRCDRDAARDLLRLRVPGRRPADAAVAALQRRARPHDRETFTTAGSFFVGQTLHFINGIVFAVLYAVLFLPLMPFRNTRGGNLASRAPVQRHHERSSASASWCRTRTSRSRATGSSPSTVLTDGSCRPRCWSGTSSTGSSSARSSWSGTTRATRGSSDPTSIQLNGRVPAGASSRRDTTRSFAMTKLFPTSLVGSYAQPDWLIDRAKLRRALPAPRPRPRAVAGRPGMAGAGPGRRHASSPSATRSGPGSTSSPTARCGGRATRTASPPRWRASTSTTRAPPSTAAGTRTRCRASSARSGASIPSRCAIWSSSRRTPIARSR